MPNPSISVVIPTHGGGFLSAATQSVRAQTFADWELIIVDDGSTDSTAEVARSLAAKDRRVRVVTNPHNTGIAAARNRGLAAISSGSDFVAFLDHDDLWIPEALGALRAALVASAKASAAHGTATGIDELGATVPVPPERHRRMGIIDGRLVEWPRWRPTEFANLAYENCIVSTGSGLIRRKELDAVEASIRAPRRQMTTTYGSASRAEATSRTSTAPCWPTAATPVRRHCDRRHPGERGRPTSATRSSPRPTTARNSASWRSLASGRGSAAFSESAGRLSQRIGEAGTFARSRDICSTSWRASRPRRVAVPGPGIGDQGDRSYFDLASWQSYRRVMRMSFVVVGLTVGVLALVGGGSSGGSSASLDCAYLASDTNCWKTTAASASTCLPAESEIGTFSADGKTCTFATGDVVTFSPALVLPLPTATTPTWNFTVTTSSGASCLAYQDDGNGAITLTVEGQTVKETTPGGLSIALSCPDGKTYSNSNAFTLLSCPDAGLFGGLPGLGWSSSDTSVSVSLVGTSAAYGSIPVFNCQTAAP